MLSNDPTKTRSIEKQWLRNLVKRFKAFQSVVTAELKRVGDLRVNAVGYDFKLDPIRIKTYITFVQLQIDNILLGSSTPPNWQALYQLRSYQRALQRSKQLLVQQGVVEAEVVQLGVMLDPLQFTATPSLATSVLQLPPIHKDALEFLFERSFNDFKGITDKMATSMQQVLQDGIVDGKGIRETTKLLHDAIGVTKKRAQLITRTETIQAYQRSQINEAVRVAEVMEEPVLLRWLTRRDGRVRPLHAGFHGQVMTTEEAQKNIGVSPWNCRCALAPVIKEADTQARRDKFNAERKTLLGLGS